MTRDGGPLALDGITVRVGGRTILDELSLEVPQGAVYALLGRNGTGKTTALACLLGLRKPDAGRAFLFGTDAWRGRAAAMAHLGVVPDEPDVPLDLTAEELGSFSAPLYPRWDAGEYRGRLRRLAISGAVPFGQLSRGQKTQVLLAAALAGRPDALVLDDPTLGLDPVARRELLAELILYLADHGTTTLLATHDLAAVEGLATHVGILCRGRLALAGDLEEIKADLRPEVGPWRNAPPRSLEEVFAQASEAVKGRAA